MIKTEKSKMMSGSPYKPDNELSKERQYARGLIFDFNTTHPNDTKNREQILDKLLGKTKGSFFIEPPFRCDYGYNIELGTGFYANYNLVILDCAKVTIGDNVLIAPNVGIYTAGHPLHFERRKEEYEYAFPINIGNNVWIGGNVIINPGITIGKNSVVGSGSVVTKDIPNDVVAVGNPCRVLKSITEADKRYFFRDLKFD